MLSTYFFPIETAAWSFPLVAILAALPYAVYCYFRYGAVSPWRTAVLSSFVFYLLCAYYLVILPLPNPAEVAHYTTAQFDWIPFHFVGNLSQSGLSLSEPTTWLPVVKSMAFLEPLFNVFLLMPFGVYLAYYFKKDWKKCLLLAFFLSFFFEMTQLSGLYGIYPRPYRLFSTDDLMLNSLGGMIGYFFYSWFLRFLPSKERMDRRSRERSASVGFMRRTVGAGVDLIVIIAIDVVVSAAFDFNSGLIDLLIWLVYPIGSSLLTRGFTPGKALVRIRVVPSSDGRLPFWVALSLRWVIRNGGLWAVLTVLLRSDGIGRWITLWLVVLGLLALTMLGDFILSWRRRKRLWYERVTHTENASTLKPVLTAQGDSDGTERAADSPAK